MISHRARRCKLPDDTFYPPWKRCVTYQGRRHRSSANPCPIHQQLYDGPDNVGICDCQMNNNNGSAFLYSDRTKQCHQLYTQVFFFLFKNSIIPAFSNIQIFRMKITCCAWLYRVRAKEATGGSSTTAFPRVKSCRKVARQTAVTSTGVRTTREKLLLANDYSNQPPIIPATNVGDWRVEGRAGTANFWNWTTLTIPSTAERRLLLLRLWPASLWRRGVSAQLLHWAGPWPGVHWAATEIAVPNALDTFKRMISIFPRVLDGLLNTPPPTKKTIQIGSDFMRW